ncbi:MAG TPA: phosphoribosylaminoimidazolesuccinocarboxamide synthase [Spirochaetes bacterium]|nr:phosphoribosylaminoimidazolesuccinocarboxamide synthase [Spirochaetota bacterium]
MKLPIAYKEIDLTSAKLLRRGKVRDIFDLGDKLLFVASDRISAFDVVLPNAIPYKGKVLNSISAFWFRKVKDIIPSHFITDDVDEFPIDLSGEEKGMLEGRSSLVYKGEMIDVECVVRGYLDGSGWKSYKKTGKLFDIPLPSGLKQGDKLPEPLFTPTTKAQSGHDESVSFSQVKNEIGEEKAQYLKGKSIELYRTAFDYAIEKGLVLADTKFEFTVVDDEIRLADEIFTPDSSRFWDKTDYKPGGPQPSYDKQYIRDWLSGQDWDRTPPAPELPGDVIERSVEKYLDVYRKITGLKLS